VIDVRTKRHRLACLKTDHKAISKEIEAGLIRLHQSAKKEETPPASIAVKSAPEVEVGVAFAVIDQIDSNGPAFASGLRLNDRLLEMNGMKKVEPMDVATTVKVSENKEILVKVLRENQQVLEVPLVPKQWSGPGLLGMHINFF
jgi:26S proteasome non-ATPase regulatory subunit 9